MLSIQNRRYLGNKYKLLGFIDETIQAHCPGIGSLFDVFAGTGVVAYHFMERMRVVTNDILYSNYLTHIAFMSDLPVRGETVAREVELYNSLEPGELEDNYMSENFGNTYFSYDDCKKIGFIRERIQRLYESDAINERERAVLITILLYAMDRVANTCGHYDAYRKGAAFDRKLVFMPLDLHARAKGKNVFLNGDSNALVKAEDFPEVDCVYCDPPYNSRNYCDMYHVLENVAKWEKPEVTGVARKMDRRGLKSRYCGKSAAAAFEDLVAHLKCKYIVLSYNNTGESADDRSNARMSDEDILRILSKRGSVKIYSRRYKAFTAGKSENSGNEERLFVCTVRRGGKPQPRRTEVVKSPLNYTGGKAKLIPQLLPLFPGKIRTFVDLFCGGGNVGINAKAGRVLYYDKNEDLINLLRLFRKYPPEELSARVAETVRRYGLSDSESYGYGKYGCGSGEGLSKYNKPRFLKLREDFNALGERDDEYYLMLYVLIVFSFNNQLRFNKKHEFNLPVGKRDFNRNIRRNLGEFAAALRRQDCAFAAADFRRVDLSQLGAGDFVYCDPPYLITTASYNERGGWSERDERDLLSLLDRLDGRGIPFALSNVTAHKGRENGVLLKWARNYRVHQLDYNYDNSNYHGKNREERTQEILVTNY